MTVKEICNGLATFNDDDRARYAGALCKKLSSVSMQTLMSFQNNWDSEKSPEEFFKAQAKEILSCVELEIGPAGQAVRQATGLESLTWKTEINEMLRYNASDTGLIHLSRNGDLCLWEDVVQLQAENKRLKKTIGDLRAAAVRRGSMRNKGFTSKCKY